MPAVPAIVTRWDNYLDLTGVSDEMAWPALFKRLRSPLPYTAEAAHPGWSPIVCNPPTRADEHVTRICALVLDYDGCAAIEGAYELWGHLFGIIHTTRKHSAEVHRFRVVLPLSRHVSRAEHARLWAWAYERCSRAGHLIDVKTRNASRFWFFPGTVEEGAPFEAHDLDGPPLDVDATLAEFDARPATNAHPPPAYGPVSVSLSDRIKRATAYLAKMPPAISGSGGDAATWKAALVLVRGFDLGTGPALELLSHDYNPRCQPPWSMRELRHKIDGAEKSTLPVGYLLEDEWQAWEAGPPPKVDRVDAPPPITREAGDDTDEAPASPAPTSSNPLEGLTYLSKVALLGREAILEMARRPINYVWHDVVVAATIVVVAGYVGEGKTTLLFLILAARMNTSGADVLVLNRPMKPAPLGKFIVLIEGEHGEISTARKLEKSCALLGVDDAALNRIIVVARKSVRIGSPEWGDVRRLVAAGLVSDIALDTIARVAPADANEEAAQVAIFDVVAQTIDAAPSEADKPVVWVAAHKRKGEGGGLEDVSGSLQRTGQADTVIFVKGERVDGRIVSSSVSFPKLREDADGDTSAVSFAIVVDAEGRRSLHIDGAQAPDDGTPLPDRILSQLASGPKTKSALAQKLARSNKDVDDAITLLFGQRPPLIETASLTIGGRERRAFALRQGVELTRRAAPDGAPDATITGRATDEHRTWSDGY